jgi:hypothetical protein
MFPTIAQLAGVRAADLPQVLDGESLVPFLDNGMAPPGAHKEFVISQFHGCMVRGFRQNFALEDAIGSHACSLEASMRATKGIPLGWSLTYRSCFKCRQNTEGNIAMSWFLATDGTYKYVVFGTGKEVPPQLFNLLTDPGEATNIAAANPTIVARLDAQLKTEIDYAAVAADVAVYNQKSFVAWQIQTPNWKEIIQKGLRWDTPFDAEKAAAFAAIADWQSKPPVVTACRKALVWPPVHDDL